MKTKDKYVQIFVHPSFKKILFKKAIDENMPVIKFTKKIANDNDPFDRLLNKDNERYKKKKFDFM